MASEEKPVKVPTSTANDGRSAATSTARNAAWSGATCIRASGPRAAVASINDCCTSSTAGEWACT